MEVVRGSRGEVRRGAGRVRRVLQQGPSIQGQVTAVAGALAVYEVVAGERRARFPVERDRVGRRDCLGDVEDGGCTLPSVVPFMTGWRAGGKNLVGWRVREAFWTPIPRVQNLPAMSVVATGTGV